MSSPETMAREKPRGLTRILRAAQASWKGLLGAYREEAAFRQELGLSAFWSYPWACGWGEPASSAPCWSRLCYWYSLSNC
jgi:hypothetical protein